MAKFECSVDSWMCNVRSYYVIINNRGRNKDYSEQKVYLSTHTSEGEQNYIIQATVQMPLPDTVIDMRQYDNDGNGINYLQSNNL